jgi:hypothetical protein
LKPKFRKTNRRGIIRIIDVRSIFPEKQERWKFVYWAYKEFKG